MKHDRTRRVASAIGRPLTLLVCLLPMQAPAQDSGETTSIRLVLVQEDGQTRAMALASGQGPFVRTAAHLSERGISVGVIASVDPVDGTEREDGFDLYTSPVGLGLPE